MLLLAAIAIMIMYVEAMAFPSLPQIMGDYGLTTEDYILASWIVTIYLVVGAVAIPIFGKLGDIHGKRKMLIVAMGIYTIAVTMTGFSREISDSVYVLIGFRAFQGMGMAMFPLAFSLIRDEFPRDRIAIAQGVISAMFGVGAAVGLVVGGFVTEVWGWEWTYHTIAPFALAGTFLVYFRVRESPVRAHVRIDYAGAALLGATLVTFLTAVTQARYQGWTDPVILTLLAISVIFLVGFAWRIMTAADPLVRPDLLKIKDIALTNAIGLIIGFALFTTNQTVVALAGFNFGLDAMKIGLLMLPTSIVMLFVGPTAGFLVKRHGPKWPMVAGMSLSIAGFLMLFQWHTTEIHIVLGGMVMGAGSSFSMVGMINMIIILTPIEETAISTGMNTVLRTAGGVVGPAIAAVIISQNSRVLPGIPEPVPEDIAYQTIFMLSSVIMAIGVVLSLWLTNNKALPENARESMETQKFGTGVGDKA